MLITTPRLDDGRPLRAARAAPRRGLPVPPTPLLGRERLLEAADALLRRPDVRLLTLLGPGGAGKTRLAIELAESLQRRFDDGVQFVDLVAARDPRRVILTIAQALRLGSSTGDADLPSDDILRMMEEADLLLVLDNFEHVLPAAHQVATLLERCPSVKVLATSRARLRLRWEHVCAVLPLDLPDQAAAPSVETAGRSPAVRLFVERAQAVAPGFRLTPGNAAAVADVCALADGLPLAIEHAAASAGVLSPQAIANRLRRRIALPAPGALDLPLRQRSLRNVVAWSLDLLSPELQTIFARLAIFEGGCTLAAAEAVCGGEDTETPRHGDAGTLGHRDTGRRVSVSDVPAGLLALVDGSLLWRETQPDGEVRFRMPETIRGHALELLAASGEHAATCCRHAAYFLDLAESAEHLSAHALAGRHQAQWFDALARDRRNLDAALAWSIQAGDAATGLRLSAALWRFWQVCATAGEARERLDGLLALAPAKPETALHAGALLGAGVLAERAGDPAAAHAIYERSVAVAKRAGERAVATHAQLGVARALLESGDYAAARSLCEQTLAAYKRDNDRRGEADALRTLGAIAQLHGGLDFASTLFRQSVRLSREAGDAAGGAQALLGLARCASLDEDVDGAEALFQQSQALFDYLDDGSGVAAALTGLGQTALQRSDLPAARSHCTASLTAALRVDDRRAAVAALLACAALAAAVDQPERALRLAGAAAAHGAAAGAPLPASWQDAAAPYLAQAEHLLGEDAAEAAYAAGRNLPLEPAVAEALTLASPPAAGPLHGARCDPEEGPVGVAPAPEPVELAKRTGEGGTAAALTRREREIAVLVAQGFTNRQVAAMLFLSERTVDTHVEHILKKLEMRSRTQITAWVIARGLIDQTALAAHPS